MQKSTIFLLIMALASAGVSAGLWMQLRAERALNADLTRAPQSRPCNAGRRTAADNESPG